MKKFLFILYIFSVLLLASCSLPLKIVNCKGEVKEQVFEDLDAKHLEVRDISLVNNDYSRVKVDIIEGNEKKVSITCEEPLLEKIKCKTSFDTLVVSASSLEKYQISHEVCIVISGYEFDQLSFDTSKINFDASYYKPEKLKISISGASNLNFTTSNLKELSMSVSGASVSSCQFIDSNEDADFSFSISGASIVSANGTINKGLFNISGASMFKSSGFSCNEATVNISGASTAKLHIINKVKGSVSGASNLTYTTIDCIEDVTTSGASVVERKVLEEE